MHFVIHCLDKPGALATRQAHIDAHKTYIAAAPVKVLISGPLLAPDNETPIGSCFLIEANALADVEAVNRNDPLFKAGLWERVSIHAFHKRVDNRG